MRVHKKRILISFVGTNDAGILHQKPDGAILTILKIQKFDEVHLLWNPSENEERDFYRIAGYVRSEIIKRVYCTNVTLHQFDCDDVTDHNEIYPKLLTFCKTFPVDSTHHYVAAIASGTPSMQACWILMAESGDFPLELIRSNEPRFHKPLVTSVKLGTALPRIIRLQEENMKLKLQHRELIPHLQINVKKGRVTIGEIDVSFSPIEFSYYRYFAERAKHNLPLERFSGINTSNQFLEKVIQFHKESFPDAEDFRIIGTRLLKQKIGMGITTFRGNVSKANKKIHAALTSPALRELFQISIEGKRHAKHYGICVPKEKIKIK